jgi:ribosomal protein S18 acetylase RimI-like enzyme
MNKIKIIKATRKEISDIVFLNSFVQKIHAEHYPDVFKPLGNHEEVTRFFEFILSKEKNCVLLAYSKNIPVGYLWAAFEQRPENPFKFEQTQAYIHQVSVHDQYRRQGIGHALFRKLERLAKEKGINQFALDTWAFNKNAQRFFKNLGFVTYNLNMWRKV